MQRPGMPGLCEQTFITSNMIYILATVLALIIVAGLTIVIIRRKHRKSRSKEEFSLLSIRVSKENETGPIVAEQIFSTIHGIHSKLSLWDRIKGLKPDCVSFEIANISQSIKFYVWTPRKLKNMVEGQIYAQYPDVEIFEVEDYSYPEKIEITKQEADITKKAETKEILTKEEADKRREFEEINEFKNGIGAELTFTDPDIFPIKRYPQFEDKLTRIAVDPVAGLTAPLAKLNFPQEQAWIQIIVRPLSDKWRIIFTKCIRILGKKVFANIETLQKIYAKIFCTRKKMYRMIFFPFYFLLWLQGLQAGVSKRKTMRLDGSFSQTEDDELREEMSRSHERETGLGAALDKASKLLYEVNIRVFYSPKEKDKVASEVKIREIASAFKQFHIPQLNGFKIKEISQGDKFIKRYQSRSLIEPFVMNNEELATIFHLPNKTVSTPNIYWVKSRKLEPPSDLPTLQNSNKDEYTLLGKTNFRASHLEFGIRTIDRRRHIYIIGKTGMGKSTLLENMVCADINNGKGVAIIDPHGDTAERVIDFIPSNRTNDIIIFDPSDRDHPIAFNMLENIDPAHNSIICSGLVGIFKKIYADSWGPRLEHILRNTILSLLEYPNTTMLGITRILQDQTFRNQVVRKITDPLVKSFWINEFEKMDPRQRIEAISPILNKVGQFLSSPIIRNIVGQPKSTIDLRFAMDKGKIIIVNLSKGKIGEDNSALLGAMIVTKFQLDAMSRANVPEKDRKDFYLYVDEFQNFATDSFATILSEARKYRLNLTMANQYITQMPDEVRDAVFGNVGTITSFQVGFDDAEYLAGQFGTEEVTENDLVGLSKYTAYIKLLVDGIPTTTFSIDTLPPPPIEMEEIKKQKVLKVSRERYTNPRELVEDKIKRWSENKDKRLQKGPEKRMLKGGKPKKK